MVEASDAEGILRQNLLDAGCGPELTQRCMSLARKRDSTAAQRILLTGHRRTLLDELHQAQHRIDCLDYLLYELDKKEELR